MQTLQSTISYLTSSKNFYVTFDGIDMKVKAEK